MYEADFLPVGDGEKSGDAIAMRFIRPDTGTYAHVIIDAGFEDDGAALVDHVKSYYDTDAIDLAILTHPDGDHIGGMGKVVRGLRVSELWLHNIGSHGGSTLPAAAAINDLVSTAASQGTTSREAWAGAQRFGGALTVLGPDESYYDDLVHEQVTGEGQTEPSKKRGTLLEAARGVFDRLVAALPVEVPFEAREVTPRNNSSMVTLVSLDGQKLLFTADAGVPALDRAWDQAEHLGLAEVPGLAQIAHHGSRRNASSAWLDRLLGPIGQSQCRSALLSVVADSDKHPSGRVVNAYSRRGCAVVATAGKAICQSSDAPVRPGWRPVEPLGPMDEELDEDD